MDSGPHGTGFTYRTIQNSCLTHSELALIKVIFALYKAFTDHSKDSQNLTPLGML